VGSELGIRDRLGTVAPRMETLTLRFGHCVSAKLWLKFL
jgi:hypothetical protein